MATINGTSGNDSLPGTTGDDTINPLLGHDTVDGGAGVDTLNVDYSGLTGSSSNESFIDFYSNQFAGYFYSGNNLNSVHFVNIEKLNYEGDDGNNQLTITIAEAVADGVTLNGGGGSDKLFGRFDAGTIFTVSAAGTVTSNRGTFSNFETYDIQVGEGSTVTAGDGNDSIGGSLFGTGTASSIFDGGLGDDTLRGSVGDDTLIGSAGNDFIFGGLFPPPAGGNDHLYGGDGNDTLNGGSGNDFLDGGAGDDMLNGRGGNDTLDGGLGINTASYEFGNQAVTVTLLNPGVQQDTEGAGLDTLTNIQNLIGSSGSDRLTGDGGDNIIRGGANDFIFDNDGNFTLVGGNDTLAGGGGNDTVSYVDVDYPTASFPAVPLGVTVSLALTTAQVTGAAGIDTISGFENLTGSNFADKLTGSSADNILDGGAGADTMAGRNGDDVYIVDDEGDVVTEYDNQGAGGIDTVRSSVSYTLPVNVEKLTLTGSGPIDGTGNAHSNVIIGNGAANVIHGKDGADTLRAGGGDDTIDGGPGGDTASYFDAPAAVTVSLAIQGTGQDSGGDGLDTLISIENLNGSSFGDHLVGDGDANRLDGKDGNDTLAGGGGSDSLIGGDGDDLYIVNDAGAGITEYHHDGAGGVDTVQSSVSNTLSPNVEKLVLTGSAAIDGTGNGSANMITGNGGANSLDGKAGADRLTGGEGNDSFFFRVGQADGDTITDFDGNGTAAGDVLVFQGYGAGATATVGVDIITVSYSGGSDVIHLDTTGLDAADYSFM